MSAAPDLEHPPKLRGDLAGMAQALAEFAQREFPQAETARPRIAVLVPCFNEEAAFATVVADFRSALPSAKIFVYDNNSSDRTAVVAREAGAEVRSERRQGKAMWSGACSPISMPISMCWSMATRPTMPPAPRA